MSVTITRQVDGGYGIWYWEWTSSLEDPTYYIYVDGVFVESTTEESRTFMATPGVPKQIEIVDSSTAEISPCYSGTVSVTWIAENGASRYLIQSYVDDEWSTIGTVLDNGQPAYQFAYSGVSDGTTYQLRVLGVTGPGIEGVAREFTVEAVVQPVAPVVSIAYAYDTETGYGAFTVTEL